MAHWFLSITMQSATLNMQRKPGFPLANCSIKMVTLNNNIPNQVVFTYSDKLFSYTLIYLVLHYFYTLHSTVRLEFLSGSYLFGDHRLQLRQVIPSHGFSLMVWVSQSREHTRRTMSSSTADSSSSTLAMLSGASTTGTGQSLNKNLVTSFITWFLYQCKTKLWKKTKELIIFTPLNRSSSSIAQYYLFLVKPDLKHTKIVLKSVIPYKWKFNRHTINLFYFKH